MNYLILKKLYIKLLLFISFFALLSMPEESFSMEKLFPGYGVTEEQTQMCSDKISDLKLLARDAKYCLKDADCIVIEAGCPLSCRYHMNKVFKGAIESRIDSVKKECSHFVCSATCKDQKIDTQCLNGICTYDRD